MFIKYCFLETELFGGLFYVRYSVKNISLKQKLIRLCNCCSFSVKLIQYVAWCQYCKNWSKHPSPFKCHKRLGKVEMAGYLKVILCAILCHLVLFQDFLLYLKKTYTKITCFLQNPTETYYIP